MRQTVLALLRIAVGVIFVSTGAMKFTQHAHEVEQFRHFVLHAERQLKRFNRPFDFRLVRVLCELAASGAL